MRILMVGAGAVGGYFGGRLLEAGRDVTFLVRPQRAAQLDQAGLQIKSRHGDFSLPRPPRVLAGELKAPFDAVLVACKAYDLPQAIQALAPAVGPDTALVPLLNGMKHLEQLAARFGERQVLGGQCWISAALDGSGAVLHLNEAHRLSFGERNGSASARTEALSAAFAGAKCEARASREILHEMWEKWVSIAATAGLTTLLRATVGDIVKAGGADLALALLEECGEIAAQHGFAPRQPAVDRAVALLTTPGSTLAASMLRDVERAGPTEAEHILGDLLERRDEPERGVSLLRVAYLHLKAYEARRAREGRPA